MALPRRLVALVSVVTIGLCLACGGGRPEQVADVVLTGGRVVTVDPDVPDGTAIAVAGGRVLAVGADDAVLVLAGPATRVIPLDGDLVLPGFIETHGHFLGLGRMRLLLDLRPARSWDEIASLVAGQARSLPAGTWIVGRGWHQEKWDDVPADTIDGFPTRDAIDRAAPDHPVVLEHASGHAAIANAVALAAAGIDRDTPDPAGGKIVRDARGRPTGLLHETAQGLVDAARERSESGLAPGARRSAIERGALEAARACAAHGVTTFHDAGSTLAEVGVFDDLAAAGRLDVRLRVMLGEPDQAIASRLDEVRRVDAHDGYLTVRAIKRYADGALGNRGAWLLAPYDDDPSTSGIPTATREELLASAALARDHGYQLCVHAIGDRANREVLDVYEETFGGEPFADRRWRIEHAQHVDPADIPRFGALGVIAAMQAVHCTSDGPWVPERIGERRAAEGAYAWRALRDAGAVVVNGTDVPVEPIDPIANFHAMVTRRMGNGDAFHPEQALTREEALVAATRDAARAAFDEDTLGTLAPGKRADLVVLGRDILQVPVDRIVGTGVRMTMVGGRIVHGGPDAPKER